MKKFIVEVLHEEIISEENMLTVTGGITPPSCGNADSCNINIGECPKLSCLINQPLLCPDKMVVCKGNMIACDPHMVPCGMDTSSIH